MDEDNWTEQLIKGDLLDELMAEIPGKDGYGNTLKDEGTDGYVAKVSLCYLISYASKQLTRKRSTLFAIFCLVCRMFISLSYTMLFAHWLAVSDVVKANKETSYSIHF